MCLVVLIFEKCPQIHGVPLQYQINIIQKKIFSISHSELLKFYHIASVLLVKVKPVTHCYSE